MAVAAAEEKPVDFSHDVVPVLRKHCGKCHTGANKEGAFSMNTRAAVLAGGETGAAVVSGKADASDLIKRITSGDDTVKMPPEGPRVPAVEVAVLKRWIDGGLLWQEGFAFQGSQYEPPLAPRRPELPPPVDGRSNPVDRILDAYLTEHKVARPQPIGDSEFLRRASLDLIGLLPTPERRKAFLADARPNKRTLLVEELLADDVAYAEHWLTFWNDLLRNDYTGTGFITGGRKQITRWLYDSLVTNKPYDQFARELIAPPTEGSAGFIEGIKWRGEVSAGQTVEIQFAQSLGQSLLGINLKCASCHDSFIDRWKLSESFALAAIYSTRPLAIHRCDKPTGETAQAAWLFPELGRIDAAAPQSERLKQLAALMTHEGNGRFPRTIVNRLWHRLMGRGIVHPVDAMQTEPFSSDLLDYLAVHLADQGYNLKQTLELIATSAAYQSQCQVLEGADDGDSAFAGPRARRLTAEQFLDAVWQLTGAGPTRLDAPVLRGKPDPAAAAQQKLSGQWIWTKADTREAPAGETITFRKQFNLKEQPQMALAAISCDNSYTLFVNGQQAQAGDNWESPDAVVLTSRLKAGQNELLIVGKNAGNGPNLAGLFCEVRVRLADGTDGTYGTDASWEWTTKLPNANGRYPRGQPEDWQPAVVVAASQVWSAKLDTPLSLLLSRGASGAELMVRASLVKSDFLMRTLGRPNRDQIVTVRPAELTTLEAIDLANGEILAHTLHRGAEKLMSREWQSPEQFVRWLYAFALCREPAAEELSILKESLGDRLTVQGMEDALWTVIMLPEFQLVR